MPKKERQKHGFDYENKIIIENKLEKTGKYTHKYDAITKLGTPVQIKCIRSSGSVDMGSLKRNLDKDRDFILHIGFWSKAKDNITKTITLYITIGEWKECFGNAEKFYNEMKTILNLIGNSKVDDGRWKEYTKYYHKIHKGSLFRIAFKRDSKVQKRIQCSINQTNLRKMTNRFTNIDMTNINNY